MTAINFYVIDSSSLIELNRRYPIDVFPTLWKNVEKLIEKGFLISHKEVLKEISIMDDSLKNWAKKQKKFFKELDEKQMEIVRQILAKYPSLAKCDNETAAADPFVIALAVEMGSDPQKTLSQTVKGRIIVTEEKLRGNKVKIPFVCKDYDIECINIIEMCRVEGWKF
jgi:tetrahydromethanopterin S-methyltransferase subunit A